MAELGTIRKGPKRLDIAVAMPSGWIHLRDGRRLTAEQVADWVELRPVEDNGDDQLAREQRMYVELNEEHGRVIEENTTLTRERDKLLRQLEELRTNGQPPAEQLTPDEIRLRMLRAWDKSGSLTIAEAARYAGVQALPNYTSRFATNMIHEGWIHAIVVDGEVVKRGHAKVFAITGDGTAQARKEDA